LGDSKVISLRASLEVLFSTSVTPLAQLWRAQADKCIPPALGISHALAWPLVLINHHDGALRQTELAALLGVANSSLVRSIDQLCAAGLVGRCQDPADRRANTLRLTASGKAWCKTVETEVSAFRAGALAGVTSDDLQVCLRVFAKIRENLGGADFTIPAGRSVTSVTSDTMQSADRFKHAASKY
jgi:MarR family transcriptional regulator for hemolysin